MPMHIILKYCVDNSIMSEGVSRTRRIHADVAKPKTAMKTDAMSIM